MKLFCACILRKLMIWVYLLSIMTYQVFIDGQAGTTGLQVAEKLAHHDAVTLITLDDAARKDAAARREAFAKADVAILCLPDDAASEAAQLCADCDVVLIDASTAHRTDPDWVYGMAELSSAQRAAIATHKYISNPGCYPTGFLAMAAPLRQAGILPEDANITVPAISGYTGGGKGLIAGFADGSAPRHFSYAHGLSHKHLPEMQKMAQLSSYPIFMPSVGDFAQGMLVHLPLFATQLAKRVTPSDIAEIFCAHYDGSPIITAYDANDYSQYNAQGFLAADGLAGKDSLEIFTNYNADSDQFWLTARLDNLGKGASGAAVQSLNLALGLDETTGLSL